MTLFIGLMSGTSMDGIDSAVVECTGDDIALLATREHSLPSETRARIAAISHSGDDEIERMGRLDRELGQLFAEASEELLKASGIAAAEITAIGSHGQTIRHRPPSGADSSAHSFTLQIGDPNTIAECTGITTVADFRRRDIAAGGEGAPLAPAFHAAAFAKAGVVRAIVNIGGIANASVLDGCDLVTGFDTGPGNTLMDHWIARHRGSRYDEGGNWAAEGQVIEELQQCLLAHPYLAKTGPRSTGKEAFNLQWLDDCLTTLPAQEPQNIQATLAEFTAQSIASGLQSTGMAIQEVYICGGGAHNTDLMRRLYRTLENTTLDTTAAIGMDPDWVEAAAFAWLAKQSLAGMAGNAPVVTGAVAPRVLGGIFPGSQK
ncbi:MAG: anhydro-N-acetylmuramic acid kinase [Halioglobus sp.]